MSIKLEDFRLESYKERELLMLAIIYYKAHRIVDDLDRKMYGEACDALETRLSNTQCMPGGCSICGDGDRDYGEHDA